MIRYPDLSFEKVKSFLKLSKSEPTDNGPYIVEQEAEWFTVLDKNGTPVGQQAGKYSTE